MGITPHSPVAVLRLTVLNMSDKAQSRRLEAVRELHANRKLDRLRGLGDLVLSFISKVTAFGWASDLIVAELSIESFYPPISGRPTCCAPSSHRKRRVRSDPDGQRD